jgi:hypothetical protein
MQILGEEFVTQCRIESGFRLRGERMTRIEVFVDAAFAFAVTMLVISFDSIPRSFDEMVVAIKNIPAFIAAVSQLVWIWSAHSLWGRRYGLEGSAAVALSTALLIVVLIYIYPMRVMLSGMFWWISGGYFPTEFVLQSRQELEQMFVFLGTGFIALCLVFAAMYYYAFACRRVLRLNEYEQHGTASSAMVWAGSAGIGLLSIILALSLPDRMMPLAGFAYFLLGAWVPGFLALRSSDAN